MLGIKSINICVIAIATINITRYNGFILKRSVEESEIKKTPMRFT